MTGSGLFWVYVIMMIVVPEYVPAAEDVVSGVVEDRRRKRNNLFDRIKQKEPRINPGSFCLPKALL